MVPGVTDGSSPTSHHATTSPSAPPATPSTTDSVSNWRTSRPRPAPIAERTASSRWRAAPRASNRFATLALAMRSTKPTAPTSTSSAGRTPATISSCRLTSCIDGFGASSAPGPPSGPPPGLPPGPRGPRGIGTRCRIVVPSASACEIATPSFRRAIAGNAITRRSFGFVLAGSTTNGVQISTSRFGNSKVCGSTPTTVCCAPSSTIARPTMFGSRLKRFVQAASLRSATWFAPGRSVPGSNSPPSIGTARSIGKSAGDTIAPLIRTGSPRPVSVYARLPYAAMPSSVSLDSRHVWNVSFVMNAPARPPRGPPRSPGRRSATRTSRSAPG
jgi:hypothetical protein